MLLLRFEDRKKDTRAAVQPMSNSPIKPLYQLQQCDTLQNPCLFSLTLVAVGALFGSVHGPGGGVGRVLLLETHKIWTSLYKQSLPVSVCIKHNA